jgi:hypothetical protein
LRHLQFGGETLRPDGLLGVILSRFVLLTEKLANVLLGVLRDTRKRRTLRIGGVRGRRSIVTAQRLRDRR